MTKSSKVDSSFLSFQSSKSPTLPKRPPRRRPSPIDLYELPTLEALPTPDSSSNGKAPSQDSISINHTPSLNPNANGSKREPRRLRKPSSFGDMNGTFGEKDKRGGVGAFGKRWKDKDQAQAQAKAIAKAESIKQASAVSFLPMDEDVKAPSIITPTVPPITRSRLPRPTPGDLDPSIFGREIRVTKAEDPIEQVIRMQKEEDRRAIQRSYHPEWNRGETNRPASRQRGQTIGHRPTASATTPRVAGGSTRQRNHAPMPSIQGVIEGDDAGNEGSINRRHNTRSSVTGHSTHINETLQRLEHGRGRAGSVRSFHSGRDLSSAPSSPIREYLYPDPTVDESGLEPDSEVHSVMMRPPSGRPPTYFSNKGNTSPIRPISSPVPSIDTSPTLGSIPLPHTTRHLSLTPSTLSQVEHAWRSSDHVEPDEERLTALEILEELNGDLEEGWEFSVLAKQRFHAGLPEEDKHSRRYGMTSPPPFPLPRNIGSAPASVTVVEREGSMKDVRSWRETRKKSKDSLHRSEKQRPKSLKPRRSIEGMEPLYEVSYTIEPSPVAERARPPIPPRSAGRATTAQAHHLKLELDRGETDRSGKPGVDVPLVLGSPVKETRRAGHISRIEDIPHSVKMR